MVINYSCDYLLLRGFTWDDSNFYIAYNATRTGYLNQTLYVHFDTDPDPIGGNGTSIGYRSGASLPFKADLCLVIDDINNGTLVQAIGTHLFFHQPINLQDFLGLLLPTLNYVPLVLP